MLKCFLLQLTLALIFNSQCQCQDIPNLELLLRPHQLIRYTCGVADEKIAAFADCYIRVIPQAIDRAFRKCFDSIYGQSTSETFFTLRRVFCNSGSYWSQERKLSDCLNGDEQFNQAMANPPDFASLIVMQSCLKTLTN